MEKQARLLIGRYPDSAFAWKGLGTALQMQEKYSLPDLQKAAALSPEDAEVHNHLGNAWRGLKEFDKAVASYRRALEIKPDYAKAYSNLGVALQELGQFDEALASYRRALEIKPDLVEAYNNLGALLSELGQNDNAVLIYRQALEIKPAFAEAHSGLGTVLRALGQFDEALISFRRALEIKPDFAEAHTGLGAVLNSLGQLDGALASFRRALEIKPDFVGTFSNMLFVSNYDSDKQGEEIFAAYRDYNERFCQPLRGSWRAHGNSRVPVRRLRIGYVSPDFRKHSVRHFLEPLLARHDRQAFEIYAYADLAQEDDATARYKVMVDRWIPTRGLSDEALAERIRADEIDILVDLAGHTAHNRLPVFARKPAPISVSWLGYGYTTGLTAIDYYLTDEASAPAGSEALFSETPWRLVTPAYVYRPTDGMGPVGPLPASERGHITFGTLTRAIRINHRTIRVWSEILKRVEGSRLVVNSGNFQHPTQQEALAARFAAHGIQREQLEIGYHSPPWDVLRGIDMGLDCFPHNSGTTLFETLYMGVPYITLAGRPSVGRLGSSILEGVGHPEWIALSEAEYIEKAVALAADLPKLAELRAGLRQAMEAGPLMDEIGFARKVETAYREMWQRWCAQSGEAIL
jgi:predicted O-linked N-acetylglucosamine transferase (SPINDLY family)